MTIQQQCFYIFSLLSSSCWGYLVGKLLEKRKRDKQMAHLVAERLIGKPKTESQDITTISSFTITNAGNGYINTNLQNIDNVFPFRRAVVSQYPEVRNAILENAQEVLNKALIRESNGSSLGQSKVP